MRRGEGARNGLRELLLEDFEILLLDAHFGMVLRERSQQRVELHLAFLQIRVGLADLDGARYGGRKRTEVLRGFLRRLKHFLPFDRACDLGFKLKHIRGHLLQPCRSEACSPRR